LWALIKLEVNLQEKAGQRRASVMHVAEASVVISLSPEQTWDLLLGDQLQHVVEMSDSQVAVEDYQMRADGTPRYQMVQKVGPFKISFVSDYSVFERPHRAVNRVLDSPFGGTFYATLEPTTEGTQLHWRWEIEPQNALVGRLLPVMRPLLAWSLQRGLNTFAKAAKNYQTIKAALQAREEPYLKAPVEPEAAQRPTPPEVEGQPSPPEAEAPSRRRDSESEES
jgi:hypothetical protein